VPSFTLPLCRIHHVRVTRALQRADVDMSYTADEAERLRRGLRAMSVFLWEFTEVRR